ncbi:MAG: DUF3368 domain-containing protein, partial [Pseudomonadota bacterium]
GEIIIPEAVWQEVVVQGKGQPGSGEVKSAPWIKTQAVTNRHLVSALHQELDAGEAEAIALAVELEGEGILMDEHLGRESAHHFGLRCLGLIGLLTEAKRRGLIPSLKPSLDALRDIAGFRVSELIYERVLRDEGEL